MTMADPLHKQHQVGGDHYSKYSVQVWDVVEMYDLDFFEANVLKYLLRRKTGVSRVTDLQKAQHYLAKCISRAEATR